MTNSQSLNQYAYVGDNPTNVTDPSGMDVSFDFGGFGGGGGDCLWCEWGGSGGIPPISGGGLPGMGGGFPGLGGSGCDFIACGISGSGGGANGFTNVNGNIIGENNGEELCNHVTDTGCSGYVYWNSSLFMWQDRSSWILSQAGARGDIGAKAAMAITAPTYAVMGAVAGAEAADTALTASRNIPLSPQNIGRAGDVIQGATPGSAPATGGGILGACLSGGCAQLWQNIKRLF